MSVENKKVDVDYTNEVVPSKARKGFLPMFAIMLGFTFFSASMWTGVDLANGLDFKGFMLAVLIGGIILAAYTGALGYIGCKTGLSYDLLSRRAFGKNGSKLPSAMIGLTQIGWFGVGAAMFAIPAAEVLAPESKVLPYILVLVVGVCMTASAYFGIKGLEIVSYISVPLIALLGTYAMVTATIQGGGLNAIFNQSTGGLTLFAAVGLVIGSFVSGGTATPNFTRFAKTNKIAVWTTVIAFFLGNTLMFCFGGVAGAFTGSNDIFWVMIELNLGIWAFLVLGANIWTTNDNALYTGALGLANITARQQDATVQVDEWVGAMDVVIADVPCSGLGIIRKKPDIRYKNLEELSQLPKLQLAILENQSCYVKPGGVLIYSTCTLVRRENEGVVEKFLKAREDFALEPMKLPGVFPGNETGMLTLVPGEYETDGFFIARLRRKA